MKQLIQNLRTGETIVAEVPIPAPRPGTALVRTAASIVSAGTERMLVEFAGKSLVGKARSRPDLLRQAIDKARREGLLTTFEATFNRLDQPMPLGYSSAGTIEAVGEDLRDLRVGQRVACAGGGFAVHAEFATVPRNLLAALPDEVDFESAAFATLGAIAMHGFHLAETGLGERVAVIGTGLLGLLAVGIAQAAGCHVLAIDLDPARVEIAKQMGAGTVALRDQAEAVAQSFSHGKGCDAVLICADTSSNDPVELAGTIARDRARVVAVGAVGLKLPRKVYFEKELSFINSRSYGPGRYDPTYEEGGHDYPIGYVRWTEGRNLEAFVDLLATGRLDIHPLISHRLPIEQAPAAYNLITGKQNESFLGVLLTYPVETTSGGKTPTPNDETHIIEIGKQFAIPIPQLPSSLTLGILGAGNFATAVLLPALRKIPHIERIGIASASGMTAQSAAGRYGFRYATGDESQILNDPSINTVAILTRHHLHARQVLAALESGKHVFCEKPLAINNEELEKIAITLSRIEDKEQEITEYALRNTDPLSPPPYPLLMVGFNRRFAPLALRLHEFISGRQEPLVAHYRVNAGYLPLTHWLHDPQQGGGRIIGEGCHFVDFMTFLVGEPPSSVTAQALPDSGRYHEDNVILTFTFPDGSLGVLTYLANGDKTFPKERVEVFTGGRVAVLEDYRSLEMVRDGRRRGLRSRLRQDKGHRAEWETFAAAILEGGSAPIPYTHLLGVTRATFAAVKALRTGETVII